MYFEEVIYIKGCNWRLFSSVINRSINLSMNQLVVLSIKYQKMVKNVDQCFPKPKMMSSNILFWPQQKDNQFTGIEAFKKAGIREFLPFFLKSIIKIVKLINSWWLID